ncbi:hypothetical protein MHU86_17892 [Fragilaria crotonensis]|nr:hypothetical protein MHU86_17892 [Fragilaria crotonensis]
MPQGVSATGKETVDTPVKFRAERAEYLDAEFDWRFRAFLAVVPDGATYYCHRDRRNRSIGKANEVIPMDTSWLRVVKNVDRDSSRFADGGYVSRLWDGQPFWKFKISRGEANFQLNPIPEEPVMNLSWNGTLPTLRVMSAYQCPDELGPCLPPDFINGEQHDGAQKKAHLRRVYRMALMSSKSARRGCRHYAHGYLHRKIDPNETLIIDPEDGDIDIRVAIQIRRPPSKADAKDPTKHCVALSRESVVLVRYLPHLGSGAEKLLSNIRDHASTVQGQNKHSARNGLGDHGSMFPLGSRIMKDNITRKQYVTSTRSKREQRLLKGAVVACSRLAAVTIPGILRIMQDAEEDGDIPPPHGGMNGDCMFCRISHTMDVSVDLSNSTHYDVNDASQGFSIWTEDEPGSTRNWFFILPNVYGKRPDGMGGEKGAMFHGVAIRLTHGVLISWDGRVIRHGTSVMERTKHVYGSFFAAKGSVVAYGARMAFRKEAIRRRRSKRRQRQQRHDGPGGLLISPAISGCRDKDDGVDLLSIPIARKSKAFGDSSLVEANVLGNDDTDEALGDDVICGNGILGDDNSSWSNHSYADDVNDSTSCDIGMILDLTPGGGHGLMGGLMIDVPDDDSSIESDARDDGFHQGRRPPNDRYDNLQNRGQEYPSPNDGKRRWNDFCTDRVSSYPHNGGFQHGHERRRPPNNDRYDNLQNRDQEYPSPNDGKRRWNDFCTDRVSRYPHNGGFQHGHERRRPPNNDRYDNLQNRQGQEYPSPNDGKRRWNDFCTDRVSRYPHNGGFQHGHERRRPPNNDRYDNLQNRQGQEYPSPNDGKRQWNDFCTDRVSVILTTAASTWT